jgi:uncharacterized protein YkwD
MKDHVVRNSVVPFVFGLSVFVTACSGTSDMAAPQTGAAHGTPAGNVTNHNSTGAGSSQAESAQTESGDAFAHGANEPNTAAAIDQDLIDNAGAIACTDSDSEAFRETMLAVIRAARAASRMCGDSSHQPTGLVTWNPLLKQAALSHVQDMASVNFFSHQGSDGLSVSNRADNVGYNWRAIGENIAAGQLDIAEVHQGWLDSPGHCRNIMNPLFTEVGAACVPGVDTDYGTYWAVVFGDQL